MVLAKIGIIEGAHNVFCPLCFLEEEDVEHLFGSCTFTNIIWSKLCEWVGVSEAFPMGPLLDRLHGINSTNSSWFLSLVFCWSI